MDIDPGELPRRIQYPPTPPIPVEGVQLNEAEREVSAVTTRFVGTEGGVILTV
jgi:hypothetical protein